VDNVERTREGFRAFNEGETATILELLDEHIVWRIPGRNELAGMYAGRDATLAVLRRAVELSGGTFRVDLQYAVADDEHVAVYGASGRRGDRALDIDQALVVRVADGRWVEVDAVPFDQHAFDEFWS
jgi:ketosteroid isomerase-like protein